MRRPTDIRETLYRLLRALHATTCDDQRISEKRCIVYLQHYTQRHATTNGYQRDVVSFTYSITRSDMRRPTDIRETLFRLRSSLHATTCDDQRISERSCMVYYSITRNDMRRPTDIRETLYRLLTALHAATCDDQRISERRCFVYVHHYTQRMRRPTDIREKLYGLFTALHATTCATRPTDIRRTLYRLLTALHATTCDDPGISERRCILYLQHYTQRHATTNGYQRDVVSFTSIITRNDMRRPMDIKETLYRLLTALHATTCDDQRISERRCIVYLQHYTQRHATTNGYQRDVVSFTYSITRNDMRRPMDIRETLYRLHTALHATTCDDKRISERRCIVYLQHYTQRHATINGYQREVVSFITALHATTCDDQRISEKRCIVYLQHYTQRHAKTNGYQRDVVSFTISITRNDIRRPMDIRETLYRLLTTLHAATCDDERISERRCIVYLQHYTQRHATTNGYQKNVVSFTCSITRNDMRRPTDIRETLYRLLTALHATTCDDQRISGGRCIVYIQHYTQRHATTQGYQSDVASFTYSITRNDMRRPTDIRWTLYRLHTALHATTCDVQRISERPMYRLLTALHATTCEDQWISERRCIVYLQHYTQRHSTADGYQRYHASFTYNITRTDM